MRPLQQILEAERAAGNCELDATQSGQAMRDRVWARTQASIAAAAVPRGAGDAGSGPKAPSHALTWARRAIVLSALTLAVALPETAMPDAETLDTDPQAEGQGEADGEAAPRVQIAVAENVVEEAPSVDAPALAVRAVESLPSAPPAAASARTSPPSDAPALAVRAAAPRSGEISTDATPAARPATTDDAPSASSDRLDHERRLLDQARRALATADYAAAGAALATYDTTVHEGQLREEEQVLKIRWLVASGDAAAARALAKRFEEQFPSSFFRPAVTKALLSISNERGTP